MSKSTVTVVTCDICNKKINPAVADVDHSLIESINFTTITVDAFYKDHSLGHDVDVCLKCLNSILDD